MRDFLRAPDLSRIKFAMFYETWNLGFDPVRESTPVTFQMELHFDTDMLVVRRALFPEPLVPAHRRAARRLPLPDADADRRRGRHDPAAPARCSRARGYDPYFIGDEVYWRVTPEVQLPGGPVLTTDASGGPDRAVRRRHSPTPSTSATPSPHFGPHRGLHRAIPGDSDLVADEKFLLAVYRNATDDRVPVIPDVGPGFNDRGFRLATNHPAQPRQWTAGEGPSSTLDHLFRRVAIPELDPALPMVMVTSWDDWNEDTGIEPIGGTPTRSDDSLTDASTRRGTSTAGRGGAPSRPCDGTWRCSTGTPADLPLRLGRGGARGQVCNS